MTLLRILFFGRIGSTKLVLPKWQNIDILNRDNRVGDLNGLFFSRLFILNILMFQIVILQKKRLIELQSFWFIKFNFVNDLYWVLKLWYTYWQTFFPPSHLKPIPSYLCQYLPLSCLNLIQFNCNCVSKERKMNKVSSLTSERFKRFEIFVI